MDCLQRRSHLFGLGEKAFEGITKECMIEIDLYFYKVFRHTHDGRKFSEIKHEVLVVAENDNKRYCVDPAGAQLHQFQPIMPLDLYLDKVSGKITKVKPYGDSAQHYQEIMRGKHYRELPPGYDYRVPRVQNEAHERFNIAVEEWEKSEGLIIP
ncbi:hypothetical protein AC579_3900 [Pseudocercospora musae]|uniref:Uncharacterized protein n=1 Tax=Pseudocercospora musae TaxID=113226 RepID=A0A139I359_9PEZI|nr:hypothetical protein AC579_3900 [Pseudocercospora musae]